jgi:hypothetical protein
LNKFHWFRNCFLIAFLSLNVGCTVFAQKMTYSYHSYDYKSIIPEDEQTINVLNFSQDALIEIYTLNSQDYEKHFLKAQQFFEDSVLTQFKNEFTQNNLPELQDNQATSSVIFTQKAQISSEYDSHQHIIAWTITQPATLKQDGIKHYQVNVDITLVIKKSNNSLGYMITHLDVN